VIAVGALVGIVYGALVNVRSSWTLGGLIGATHGLAISAAIGFLEIFGTRTRVGRALAKAPFLLTLIAKGLVYGSVIALVNVGDLDARLLGVAPTGPEGRAVTWLSLAFSGVVMLAFQFVLQISQIVGGRTLRDLVLGRYHRPRSEERFFLFVDIAGSTPLAERIGAAAVHRFLGRVFALASDPIDDQGGEIHQYVGDELVVTWTAADGRPGARPIACFFAIERALREAAPGFERDFGVAPRVRAALHAGVVITGEVGESKRAIVFHGDVMNTASRLEQAARELDRRFLISAAALERLEAGERYVVEDLGDRPLRGRASPVRVFAVEPRP
jgi:adenylate cyclase